MHTSIFLAQAFGIYLLVVGAALLFRRSFFSEALSEMAQSKPALILLAVVTLILGILLVLVHNVWVADWPVVITVLAWIVLLKGILRLLFPEELANWFKFFEKKGGYYTVVTIAIILGLYLIYVGYQ